MAEADPGKTFSIDDATADLGAAIERAHEGEEIVLTKNGLPYARLTPCDGSPSAGDADVKDRKKARVPGRWRGLVGDIPDSVWFDPLPDGELALWEGRQKDFG